MPDLDFHVCEPLMARYYFHDLNSILAMCATCVKLEVLIDDSPAISIYASLLRNV